MLPPPEFRAPPPSPVAGPLAHLPDPADEGDHDEFAGFLSHSLRVPKLSLPRHIFPQEATPWDPPEIDFQRLISPEGKGPDAELLRSAAATFGCLLLVNHGIPAGLVAALGGAAASAFRIPMEAKKAAARSPERQCGFEVDEEGDGEEFLWLSPCAVREGKDLAGIWPQTRTHFQEKLEGLWRAMEKIASRIEEVLLDGGESSVQSIKSRTEEYAATADGSLLCFHKHGSASQGGHNNGGIKHELLRMLVRSWSCSCCLSLHLLVRGASEFHVYSKRGWYKFWCSGETSIVVTIGDQIQACGGGDGGGFYKHVIGKPAVPVTRKEGDSGDYISMAFYYTRKAASRPALQEGKTVSVAEQVLVAAFLAIAYCIFTSIYGSSV